MHYAWMWKHFEIAAYVVAAIIVIYRPPKTSDGMGSFIERHLGDSVGFYILHLGILLVVVSGIYPQVTQIGQTGQSLILAGMVALKLTKTAPPDTQQVETITSKTLPAPPDPTIPTGAK
jgi:hypothetical protein